jgi:glyoxylase-like metal-dependent hydrolase (beta-lactamase superfamily II)
MLTFTFPAGPLQTNAVLVGCPYTHVAAVIDLPLGCVGPISQLAEKQKLKIEKILFTHSHWDHIADAAEAKRIWKVPFWIHGEDAKNLEEPGSDGLPLMIPIEGVKADHFLKEGDLVEVGKLKFKVIHTPGHTPGCICFWEESEKVVISGDTLFKGAIGNLHLPTSRPHVMRGSLKKLAALPKETRVIAGHGKETTIGAEYDNLTGAFR